MHSKRAYKLPKPLLCDADAEIDMELINKYVALHEERFPRYEYLENLYMGFLSNGAMKMTPSMRQL
ncbi:hypothetical protein [Extibacter muris]|uniref:Uncharacterized protein n=1 Tax=Extibacter muris TaxID=1796622 RepID=A0A4R4F9V4_9FIRM|nr:hypothetical protein [Extibacter muris]MCU0081402.1 hypothetical protein [Extibacter muris]TDA20101.1 hypothetical protein E1963_18970 [Extibacter muris]